MSTSTARPLRIPPTEEIVPRRRDSRTNALLWGFTEHVQWAILQGKRDENFDLTLNKIVAEVRTLLWTRKPGQPRTR